MGLADWSWGLGVVWLTRKNSGYPALATLHPAAQTVDFTAVALGGFALARGFEARHGFALFGHFEAQLAAGLGLAVQRLRDGGWAADFAQAQNFDLEIAAGVFHLQQVADADLAGELGGLAVGGDAAEVAGAGSQRTSLEESRGPEPFIESHRKAALLGLQQHALRLAMRREGDSALGGAVLESHLVDVGAPAADPLGGDRLDRTEASEGVFELG